jgi:hypothetical protein
MKYRPTWPHLLVMIALLGSGLTLSLSAVAWIIWQLQWPYFGIAAGAALCFLSWAYVQTVSYLNSK